MNIKNEVITKLLYSMDKLNLAIDTADHNDIRAIDEALEDIAFTIIRIDGDKA